MLTLVFGGAASGKSEFAEKLAVSAGGRRIYLATMAVRDGESEARVARHRRLRQGKGFETVEAPTDLLHARIPAGGTVLLECLSNLAANECFGPQGFPGAAERMLSGVDRVNGTSAQLVIVSNELFRDGGDYGPETMAYLGVLAALNRAIADRADRVFEVVCGIPIAWKGGKGI